MSVKPAVRKNHVRLDPLAQIEEKSLDLRLWLGK